MLELEEANQWRRNAMVYNLTKAYFHSPELSCNDIEPFTANYPYAIVELMRELQDKMIQVVSEKRLFVETLPSSNVIIGEVNQYADHPIFRFRPIRDDPQHSPKLAVTINTDDPGVFSLSLENEYALLFQAAIKQHNEVDAHPYTEEEVYAWLDNIRDLSMQQARIFRGDL